ncbi:MAG TPA: ATP-binding protein, partial [Gemmatimonadaceae bacterium]|nr:ATP-binding protein [Gemmatimonadaceae bacterium]
MQSAIDENPSSRSPSSERFRALLEPSRLIRWVYLGRLAGVGAILLAMTLAWTEAERTVRQLAPLLAVVTIVFTVASALYTEIYHRPSSPAFQYAQSLFDLVFVTVVVHLTGSALSQFAALYILVIAIAALLLPTSGALLIALLGCVLYFADVLVTSSTPLGAGVWLQLLVFATVAVGCGSITARLREAGAGTRELANELVKVRLSTADILRNIRSGIVTVDTEGRLLYANPAASRLLGRPLDEHAGSDVLSVIASVAPELASALGRAVRSGIPTARAEGSVLLDDRSVPIGLHTTRSDGDGDPETSSATAIFQDISDQKRLDTLHLRAERLEAVAELSASLAHEIKNPLASIRSAVEQLAHRSRATEDERTLAELIVREADRLSRLLTEFLDFARVRVSRVERLDVGHVASGAAGLAAAHPDRAADVTVECSLPEEPLEIEGDEDLIHRAIFNLALNAVQASPPGGRVHVALEPLTTSEFPVGVSFDRGGIALRVTDQGPGIPVEIRERLFDPFFTTKSGGSGLGLSVVHRAIEAHRGLTFIDSDAGG